MDKEKRPVSRPAKRFWLVQQHDEFTITESSERPETTVEPGERMKRAFGPFATKDQAQKRKEHLEPRTLKVKNGRG